MRRHARPMLPDHSSSSSVPLLVGTSGNEYADVAQIGSGRQNLQKLAMRIKVAVAVMCSKRPRSGGGVERVFAAEDGACRVRWQKLEIMTGRSRSSLHRDLQRALRQFQAIWQRRKNHLDK